MVPLALAVRDAIYQQSARLGQALSSPQRLRMLNLLAQRPRTVTELGEMLGESKASASAHLKVLRAACLVTDERRGREVWCALASDDVAKLLVTLRATAETLLPELQDVVRQAEQDERALVGVSLKQLAMEVKTGRVRLVDLRPVEEFEAGHLPGAQSVPLETLTATQLLRLKASFGDDEIVSYCRGPWCVAAREGVAKLARAGLAVKRLPAGVTEWRAQGLRLAV